MNCDDSNELGGAGCVLAAEHDGDHMTREGTSWPRLVERDCPRCGARMYTGPTTSADQLCAACQDEDGAELPPRFT